MFEEPKHLYSSPVSDSKLLVLELESVGICLLVDDFKSCGYFLEEIFLLKIRHIVQISYKIFRKAISTSRASKPSKIEEINRVEREVVSQLLGCLERCHCSCH